MTRSQLSALKIAPLGAAIRGAIALAALAFLAVSPASAEDNALKLATDVEDPHSAVYSEEAYPTASQCQPCHQQIYSEWSSSNHAYASISPMFHKFEQKITDLSQGTIGSFCVRCHQTVGTQRGEKRHLPLWERSQVAREGITCITCHRVAESYGKVNGERNIAPGNIYKPMAGALRETKFDEVIENKDDLLIAVSDEERGSKIHTNVIKFADISKSEFCVSCHQVAVNLGIKLEVVWDQYRDSPAFQKGDTCQDCHMGKVPGVAAGYETGPSAVVNGTEINPGRRHSNHAFYGPGYPIAHPGIFPHNPEAEAFDIEDWLAFDYRGGWGTEEFEDEHYDLTAAYEEFHFAIESLGGGLETFNGLEAIERNIERGPVGFETVKGLERMLARLEPLDGILDTDEAADALDEARDALATVRDVTVDMGGDAALVDAVSAGLSNVEGNLAAAGGFDDAYASVVETLESFKGNPPTEEQVADLAAKLAALNATIPAASREFRAALHAAKDNLNVDFPFAWADIGDREDAWAIIEVNLAALEDKRELRKQVMENGSRIDGPFFDGDRQAGEDLDFAYVINNIDEGHNLPSGSLGAQPEIWLNVALTDPDGNRVWESGYVDSNGDFADIHSLDVAAGTVPYDDQIFNLQTKFLTTNVKGTDREMYLPINLDIDQRPFLRPAPQPTTVLNHAPFVRMEGRSIPPLGSKTADYSVPGELLTKPGKYKLSVRLRSRAEPIYFMKFVGSTVDMEQSMNEWMLDFHAYTVEFDVN